MGYLFIVLVACGTVEGPAEEADGREGDVVVPGLGLSVGDFLLKSHISYCNSSNIIAEVTNSQ